MDNVLPPVQKLPSRDKVGAVASLICALHCVVLALLPLAGLAWHSVEADIALGALTIGWASYCAWRQPSRRRWLLIVGAALAVLLAVVLHDYPLARLGWIGAAVLLMLSHFSSPAKVHCCPSKSH